MIELGWFGKSVVAMVCFIPLTFMFNFFGKNYGVKPEVLILMWLIGTSIGIFLFTYCNLIPGVEIKNFYPTVPILYIIILGIVLGTLSNLLLFQAVSDAPNPGLPFIILNVGSVIAYLLAPVIAMVLPQYFDKMTFNWYQFGGIGFIICGIGLIMLKR